MTGIQMPVLAWQDLKHHPYLWNHWCCIYPGRWPIHRWAVGSGHHTVLLAGLKVCGSLSGFEEKQLCENVWKWNMMTLMIAVLEQLDGSSNMWVVSGQLHCREHCRYPPVSDRSVSWGLAWLCAHKDKERGKLLLHTALASKRSKLPLRKSSVMSRPCSPGTEAQNGLCQKGPLKIT